MSSELSLVDKARAFADWLVARRKELGKGLKQCKKKIRKSRSSWHDWEEGTEFPTEKILPAIAKVLETDLVTVRLIWKTSVDADKILGARPSKPKSRADQGIDIYAGSCGKRAPARAGHGHF